LREIQQKKHQQQEGFKILGTKQKEVELLVMVALPCSSHSHAKYQFDNNNKNIAHNAAFLLNLVDNMNT